jgi:hypothetical protein
MLEQDHIWPRVRRSHERESEQINTEMLVEDLPVQQFLKRRRPDRGGASKVERAELRVRREQSACEGVSVSRRLYGEIA